MRREITSAAFGVFVLAVALVFAGLTTLYTTDRVIQKDAAQNMRGAYNLVHSGVISLGRQENGRPVAQMRREPLPIAVLAGLLLLHPAFAQPYTIEELLNGRLTETVKQVNIFWRFLAAIFLFLLCFELFPDHRVAAGIGLVSLAASELLFFASLNVVDRIYTELPEAALMLLAAWSAVRFVRSKTKPRAAMLGFSLGLLALCKAAFLFIGLGFLVLLLVTERPGQFHASPRRSAWANRLLTYAVIALAMVATVGPWIARNAVLFGTPKIASGTDASVLGIRMLLLEHSLLGQVYLYSPPGVRKRLVGPLTGYSEDDLKQGGRLEQAAAAKDNRTSIFAERMREQGYSGNRDEWLKAGALKYVAEHPLRYVASIPLFAYKGIWFMDRAGPAINFAAMVVFLCIFFAALFTRDQILLAAFGLPAGLYFFIALFTHALARYTVAMTPFVILACLWLVYAMSCAAYRRFPFVRDLAQGRMFQRRSDPNSSIQRSATTPTSSVETASRA